MSVVDTGDYTSFDYFASKAGRHRLLTSAEERLLSAQVRAGADARQRLNAGEKGAGLRRCVATGTTARNELVQTNLRLVMKHARRFAGSGVDLLDLVQEGSLALIRAAERFDGRKGFRFSTYADSWIAAYMAICWAETRTSIRIPKKVHSNIEKVQAATERLASAGQRRPTDDDIAAESGLSQREVTQARSLVRVTSLDAGLAADSDSSLVDIVADEGAIDPLDHVVNLEQRGLVRGVIAGLSDLESTVIALMYGLEGSEPCTSTEVGRMLGLRRRDVVATESAALERIRDSIPLPLCTDSRMEMLGRRSIG